MTQQVKRTPNMPWIAQVLWNAGLYNYPSDEEILGWCVEYVENEIPLEGCTMYTYFRDGEGPRKGSVSFDVHTQARWEFTIEYLKLLVKHGRLNLNGVTVKVLSPLGVVTKTIRFTDNKKQNIRRLNKLKKLEVTQITVRADGEIELYLH